MTGRSSPSPAVIYGLLRFAFGLRAFLKETVSTSDAEAELHRRMQARSHAFLNLAEAAIFGNPRSPYLQLFRSAGCDLGDLTTLVSREGVDGALHRLLTSGIYVRFDEFKGRAVAIRGSQRFHFEERDFDNPLMAGHYRISSSGTGGRPSRIMIDLDYLAERAPLWALWLDMHGALHSPLIFLSPYYPGIVNRQLICAKVGNRFTKWFSTGSGGTVPYRFASAYVHGVARRIAGFPRPESVPLADVRKVARYLSEKLDQSPHPVVITSPGHAVRVCLAAQEHGLRLQGVTFLLGAEPLTAARRQTIEGTGAKAVPNYGLSEVGTIGCQCRDPAHVDDVHIALDAFAVLSESGMNGAPDRLLVTTLQRTSPKIMLNAENGDSAVLENRLCGCRFDSLGYRQHLHTIRSAEKLTGDGVTFAGPDLVRLLEETLPRTFGGSITDYQLVEEQDASGLPRYTLMVSPHVGALDEARLLDIFFDELRKLRPHYGFMVGQWAETGVVGIRRAPPVPTPAGKVLPILTLYAP